MSVVLVVLVAGMIVFIVLVMLVMLVHVFIVLVLLVALLHRESPLSLGMACVLERLRQETLYVLIVE
jgi:hypothetical protein